MAGTEKYKDRVFDRSAYAEPARAEVEAYDRALARDLGRCGARDTPILWSYVRAVNSALMVVKHIEGLLFGARPAETPDADADPKKDRDMVLIEALGKAWERWRRAVKDLEDYLMKTGSPTDIALADVMKPILKQAEGVLEDALEFDARKQQKKRRDSSQE